MFASGKCTQKEKIPQFFITYFTDFTLAKAPFDSPQAMAMTAT